MERSFFSVSELIERLTQRHVRHTILAPWVSTKEIAGSEDARPAAYPCFGTLHAPQCATQVFFSWEFTCAPRYRPNRNNSFAYSPTRTTEPSPTKFAILVGVRFPCAALASGTMLLFRRQGEDGTRVFTVSSVLGPTEAQRCQVGPRPTPAAERSLFRNSRQAPTAPPAASANRAKRLWRTAPQIAPTRGTPDTYCECPSSKATGAASATVCRARQ
jgi:hypothetical protein